MSKVVLIGAGAIGGVTALLLAEKNVDLTVVCRNDTDKELFSKKGLHMTGVLDEKMIKVNAVSSIEDLNGKYDFFLIVTKAYDMPDVAKQLLPFAKVNSLFVAMQNGICTDALKEVVGQERTVGCVITFGSTMSKAGEYQMTSTGGFEIGSIGGAKPQKMQELKAVLSNALETKICEDIFAELYSKLLVNSCITSIGAVCGLKLGQMLKIKKAREIFLEILREGIDVANAIGVKVPAFSGKLDYYKLLKGQGFFANLRRHLVIYVVGLKYRKLKSSSLQSLERGKKTEIDYFNGYIDCLGKANNVATPVNRKITSMVKEIENGTRKISVENLTEF